MGALAFVPVGAAVLFSKPLVAHDSPTDHLMELAGWFCFLAYLFFRVWATLYVGGRKEKVLVTEGPYSICRNPLYLGSLCWAVALALFLHSILLLGALFLVACIYARRVIPSEESVLRSLFGDDLDRYRRTAPLLVPSFAAYRAGENVMVNLAALRREMKRLLLSALVVLAAFVLCHLRGLPSWPHMFTLP